MNHFFVFKEVNKKNEFIKLYEDSYYLDKGTVGQIAPNASGSRKFIENTIDGILVNGVKRKLDIVHILAWKMSKFVQSNERQTLVYAKDWEELQNLEENEINDSLCVQRYGNSFEIGKNAAKRNWQTLLEKIYDLVGGIYGLGPVYLITLMYFVSRGVYPIYDQFAMMALCAIEEGKKPGEKITYKGLSSVKDLLENDDPIFGYQRYIDLLYSIFDKEDLFVDGVPCRSVDRALWVYGHYFKPQTP